MGPPCATWSSPMISTICLRIEAITHRRNFASTPTCFTCRFFRGNAVMLFLCDSCLHDLTEYIHITMFQHTVQICSSRCICRDRTIFPQPCTNTLYCWVAKSMRMRWCRSGIILRVCWVCGVSNGLRPWVGVDVLCSDLMNCVCCPVYCVLYQDVWQFTQAGCVGRDRNADTRGIGKVMQQGCMRGKRLCVWCMIVSRQHGCGQCTDCVQEVE